MGFHYLTLAIITIAGLSAIIVWIRNILNDIPPSLPIEPLTTVFLGLLATTVAGVALLSLWDNKRIVDEKPKEKPPSTFGKLGELEKSLAYIFVSFVFSLAGLVIVFICSSLNSNLSIWLGLGSSSYRSAIIAETLLMAIILLSTLVFLYSGVGNLIRLRLGVSGTPLRLGKIGRIVESIASFLLQGLFLTDPTGGAMNILISGERPVVLGFYKVIGRPASYFRRFLFDTIPYFQGSTPKFKVTLEATQDYDHPQDFIYSIQFSNEHRTPSQQLRVGCMKTGEKRSFILKNMPLIYTGDSFLIIGEIETKKTKMEDINFQSIYVFHTTSRAWLALTIVAGLVAAIFGTLGSWLLNIKN